MDNEKTAIFFKIAFSRGLQSKWELPIFLRNHSIFSLLTCWVIHGVSAEAWSLTRTQLERFLISFPSLLLYCVWKCRMKCLPDVSQFPNRVSWLKRGMLGRSITHPTILMGNSTKRKENTAICAFFQFSRNLHVEEYGPGHTLRLGDPSFYLPRGSN